MKLFLLIAIVISMVQKEMLGNPLPENDVHFHVNMPGAGKSYPLKSEFIHFFIFELSFK